MDKQNHIFLEYSFTVINTYAAISLFMSHIHHKTVDRILRFWIIIKMLSLWALDVRCTRRSKSAVSRRWRSSGIALQPR